MGVRKKKNSLMYDTSSLVGAGVGIGIGVGTVARVEARAGVGTSVLPALGTTGRMLGVVGTVTLGKHALRGAIGIGKDSKRKRRRRLL